MKVTLLDEHGTELTEVISHVGRSSCHLLVDSATRPDMLFRYYFDQGRRTVTLVSNAVQYSAVLETRWQMGARFWFLHQFSLVRAAPSGGHVSPTPESALVADALQGLRLKPRDAAQSAPIGALTSEPRNVGA
jgi:hypothetical protein